MTRTSFVVVLGLMLSGPASAQEPSGAVPAAPLSEQALAAIELRAQADQWRDAGNFALNVAIGLSTVGLLFYDDLEDHPTVDRGIVVGIVGGMATWAISGWMMKKLRREADTLSIDGVSVAPAAGGGAAVHGALSW